MMRRHALYTVTLLTVTAGVASAQSVPREGFFDLNGYRDTRDFSTLTSNILVGLPHGLHYFSFTNHFDAPGSVTATDVSSFYSEQNLRWGVPGLPVDATIQGVLRSGADNDLLRLGLRLRLNEAPVVGPTLRAAGVSYAVNAHVAQFQHAAPGGWAWQVEHAYRWAFAPWGRAMYVAGFLDQNLHFDDDPATPGSRVVTEHQVGVRLAGALHAVLEWRRNGYAPDTERSGWGYGLQYVMPFRLK